MASEPRANLTTCSTTSKIDAKNPARTHKISVPDQPQRNRLVDLKGSISKGSDCRNNPGHPTWTPTSLVSTRRPDTSPKTAQHAIDVYGALSLTRPTSHNMRSCPGAPNRRQTRRRYKLRHSAKGHQRPHDLRMDGGVTLGTRDKMSMAPRSQRKHPARARIQVDGTPFRSGEDPQNLSQAIHQHHHGIRGRPVSIWRRPVESRLSTRSTDDVYGTYPAKRPSSTNAEMVDTAQNSKGPVRTSHKDLSVASSTSGAIRRKDNKGCTS
ncbi:hypothetical protein DFP72DRAFT_1167256 [Ephemerocybe angulata]|uniref:Uncharacterized protein n=1 Tax=Ephemerocybe angulata TaxID=980116 RepID=A0A8H6I6P1_9AGAR|nr:hypothetical protein DFP72DRAFT_1167256 [Tulosesus angulatus]